MLPCLFGEVLEHEFQAGTSTEEAAAVPPADGAWLEESREHLGVIGVTPTCSMISSSLTASRRSTVAASYVCAPYLPLTLSTSPNRHGSTTGVPNSSRRNHRWHSSPYLPSSWSGGISPRPQHLPPRTPPMVSHRPVEYSTSDSVPVRRST